jgi:hypothetical protein
VLLNVRRRFAQQAMCHRPSDENRPANAPVRALVRPAASAPVDAA